MQSPSAQAYERGVQIAAAFSRELNRCRHPQAEPVILSTGELVVCVCIGCYQQLPADYIEAQVEQAHLEACCICKDTVVEIMGFRRRDTEWHCTECGKWTSNSTFPVIHPRSDHKSARR